MSQLLNSYIDYLHYTGQINCENHGCVATLCFFTFHFLFYVVKNARLGVQLGLGMTNSACFGLNTCFGYHRHNCPEVSLNTCNHITLSNVGTQS